MKKINEYEFNDGLDGVIRAKSLKQAAKKVAKAYKGILKLLKLKFIVCNNYKIL